MRDGSTLEILMGPANGGQTARLLAEYIDVLTSGRGRVLWIAPAQAAADEVRTALALSLGEAVLEPGVTTFPGLSDSILKEAGRLVRVVTPLERRRVLRRAIDGAATDGALKHFQAVAGSAGLLNLADRTIARLKRGDVSPDEFAGSSTTLPRREIAELYGRYEARLRAAKLTDADGLLQVARDVLRERTDIAAGLELAVVDGFTDFSLVQWQILQQLVQRSKRTAVTLPGDGAALLPTEGQSTRTDLFARAMIARQRLEEIGGTVVGPRPELAGGDKMPARSSSRKIDASTQSLDMPPAMAHLERNLFRDYGASERVTAAVKKSASCIQIIAASSEQAEIEEIARRVKELLVAGVPPGDVVVAFRSTSDVADRVRAAFADFGIPTHLDAPRKLAATPLVRSLVSVLRLHAEDWPYRRVLQVLGDRSLRLSESDCDAAQSERTIAPLASRDTEHRRAAELCVRHAQLPSGRESLLEQVKLWTEDAEPRPDCPEGVFALAGRVIERLAALLDELPEQAAIGQWLEALERLAARIALPGGKQMSGATPLPSTPLTGEGAGGSGATVEHAQSWLAIKQGLCSVRKIDALTGAPQELTSAKFVDLLEATAQELPAPEDRDPTGKVQVLSAEAARYMRPRHLFLGGLSEQAFSRGVSDNRRRQEKDDEPVAVARSAEMLLFYQLVTRPTDSLALSYPALDAKGQTLPPSPFLVELERCFGDGVLPTTRQSLGYAARQAGPPLSRSGLRRLAMIGAQERKRQMLAAMSRSPRYGDVGRSMLAGVEVVASRADHKFGRFEGVIASDAVQAVLERRYGSDYLWSPSKLETYATCPYRFFGEHVLELAPLPELALESDLARRGSLLHDTLARLYARLNAISDEGVVPTPEAVAERFEQTLDEIVRSRPRRGLEAVLREIERRQIASWAKSFGQQHHEYSSAWQHLDSPFTPRYFEARFGPKARRNDSEDDASLSTNRAFELVIDKERLKFTGQIDRIDVGRVGGQLVFNVIDYKTSAHARVKEDQIQAGMQIQLPLYAMAVAELLLADRQAMALSAGYWSIRGKGFGLGAKSGGPLTIGEIRDGHVQLSARWTELRESLLGRIGEIVTGIRHGWFPVVSGDENCTQYCPLSTGCRIAHVRSLEKSWLPPREQA